jgi:colanic acid/amylovoran biosynthesis glycosyltransferase
MRGVALYSENGFKETFTRTHRDKMSFDFVLTGSKSLLLLEGKNIFHKSFFIKLKFFLLRRVLGKTINPIDFFFKTYKPKLIVVEYVNTAAEIVNLAEKYNVRIIVNAYGYDVFRKDFFLNMKSEYLKLFSVATKFSVQSFSIKRKLIELGCDENKIIVNTCAPSNNLNLGLCNYESNNFIAAGRFVPKKAPFLTILAFNEVVKKHKEAKLVFVGDGMLFETCKQMVKALELESNVVFKGALSHEILLSEYKNSFCFLQHSIEVESGDSEGLPVAMIEAHSCGLPIVSTLHSGIDECVKDGETGFLVAENNIKAMSDKMLQLWGNRDLARKMGVAGKEFVKNRFSEEKHINVLSEIIQKALIKERN